MPIYFYDNDKKVTEVTITSFNDWTGKKYYIAQIINNKGKDDFIIAGD